MVDANPTPQPTPTPSPTPSVPGAPQPRRDYSSMPKAGFLYRLIAWIIDAIVVVVIVGVVATIVGAPFFLSGFEVNPVAMAARQAFSSALGLLIGIGYFVYFWGTSGATPGKMALGLKVIGTDGTMPISYVTAFIRYIGYIVSTIVCLLGYLLIIVDEDNQGLHDKIAGTYVVRVT